MSDLKRAKEAPDFVVDEDAGALLNTNEKGLDAYRRQREIARKNRRLETEVQDLKAQMSRIEQLLIKALQK